MALQNTQYITLTSSDRVRGTSGDAYFRVPQLDLPTTWSFWLVGAQVPLSFYYLEAPDNTVHFRETGAVTASASFTITPGSYTSAQLAVLLEAGLDGASPNSLTYSVSYNANTGKMTVATNDAGVDVQWTTDMSAKLFLAVGFYSEKAGGGYTYDTTQSGVSITSGSVCRAGPTHLSLETSLPTRGFHSTHKSGGVMADIPITGGYMSYTSYTPQDRVEHIVENGAHQLQNLRVSWRRDDTNALVQEFNGIPWSVTLAVRGLFDL